MTDNLTTDPEETLARSLVEELHKVGVTDAVVHWDRSPWGARIPLTEDRGEYKTPSLFVLVEGTQKVGENETPHWFGQLGDFREDGDDGDLQETYLSWIVREWLGESLADLARTLKAFTDVLKAGTGTKTTFDMTIKIENVYPDDVVRRTMAVSVPAPPEDHEDLNMWAEDHLYPLTGTGRTEGDAGYFVTVLKCPYYPALEGNEFEWGI